MMRRLFMIVLAAAAMPLLLPAQPDARIEELRERLELTPEQEEKIRPILERQMEAGRRIVEDLDRGSASRRQKRKALRELRDLREETDAQLKTILTPDQMKELKRIREERKQKLRPARGAA